MSKLVDNLIRSDLSALTPYQSARRLSSLEDGATKNVDWLNANENPCMPPLDLELTMLNRYPDAQPESLINAYAKYASVKREQVLVTRGADEGIELLIRTFCNGNGSDTVLTCPPTYGMYAISAKTQGARVLEVPLQADCQLDMTALPLKLTSCKLVFLCSPNNPTGTRLKPDDLRQILQQAKDRCLVVVDEAYIEFCPDSSLVSWLIEFDNLVILRTLSKAFGLAGLRCGFTLAAPDIINALQKVIAPYPIAAPVAQLATKALSVDGIDWMQSSVTALNQLKQAFIQDMSELGIIEKIYPSDANFVLFKFSPSVDVKSLMAHFRDQQVLLRDLSVQPALENTLRVSIGNKTQMARLINLFKEWK